MESSSEQPTKTCQGQSSAFNFAAKLSNAGLTQVAHSIETLQVNITKLCNQACVHCHVDSSPRRREMMSDAVIDRLLELLCLYPEIQTLDITGGAPELHPRFRYLAREVRALGRRVIVRHNLTVTHDPHPITGEALGDLPDFFASERLEIVSSLPCYTEGFTDKQRGQGVFAKSIRSLEMLNQLGYGQQESGLLLHLVYNPSGTSLPGDQAALEAEYKKQLAAHYGIQFNRLYCITNMPIHRFKAQLLRAKAYEEYLETLLAAFNPAAAQGIMCRSMLSVAFDGKLYDCDFNQMLGMELNTEEVATVFNFDFASLRQRNLRFGTHCFACSAGSGSSCSGAQAKTTEKRQSTS